MRNSYRFPTLMMALAVLAPAPAGAATSLHQGDHGKAVAGMQSVLARLGYLPWSAVDGDYNDRTYHAVVAFEGYNGLERDGIADHTMLLRLKKAKRYGSSP